MTIFRITEPAIEPITMDDVKLHLRLDASVGALEDAMLTRFIKSARERAEHVAQRAFIEQTWGVRLDCFPEAIELLMTPVISITSIKFLDVNNIEQTLAPTDYLLDAFGDTAYIVPASGKTWPSTYPEINAVRVSYVAGYGASAAQMPECVKDWMLLIIEDAYRNRGATVPSNIAAHPFLDRILDPVMVMRVG
jgi:uncharacterized phiE125 gp8 family phage protein